MPCCLIPVPDIEQTVTRPTVYQIVKQIYEIAELPLDTEIVFAGKRGARSTAGSTISDAGHTSIPKTRFSASNITFITVTEDYNAEAVQEIQPMAWDNRPIFVDSAVGLTLRPVYLPSMVEIEVTFRHSSETEIRKWISKTMARVSHGRDVNLHDITYTFPITHAFTLLLEDVHTLRETVEGYGEDLGEYFEKHRSSRMTILSNQAGEQRHIVVKEKQSQILGQFSFPVVPEKPEHLQDLGLWQGRFTYQYRYDRPDQLLVEYPIAVHNQYMPEKYWKHLLSVVDYQDHRYYQSFSYHALQNFSSDRYTDISRSPYPYIQIPAYDDFGEKYGNEDTIFPSDTATILIAMSFLDEDKKTLLNLRELGDYYIDEDVLGFLVTESPYINFLHKSIFNISVYQDGVRVTDDKIEVTPSLDVRFTEQRSMRSRYHVRLSAIPNMRKPLYDALKRLTAHPKAFYKVIRAMNELLMVDPDFANWEKTEKVEDWMFTAVWRILFVSHQGNLASSGTNIDPYIAEHITTIRNNFHLLTKKSPEEIIKFLKQKWRIRLTHMNGYLIARQIEPEQLN